MQENRLECNGWLFKQGRFVADLAHEYCTGTNGRGIQRASGFENAFIFTGGSLMPPIFKMPSFFTRGSQASDFENALNFDEILSMDVYNTFKYQQKKTEIFSTNFNIFYNFLKVKNA